MANDIAIYEINKDIVANQVYSKVVEWNKQTDGSCMITSYVS